ncbi:SDR family oxidoreductase [Kribbella deserti]|uniref:SDR family oxidoreductase n=1 Tax=Kribbella deserti TaxID=1926257 RepID=A0ABV6QLI2_9ACTN
MLNGKNAIVYGAGGPMGGAAARAMAGHGARVWLAGRTEPKLAAVAAEIEAAGGSAEIRLVDVEDRAAVDALAAEVRREAGSLDISYNATTTEARQNQPLVDMSVDDFLLPVVQSARRQFITATAAAKQMTAQGSGVIITLTASASEETRHEMGGFNLACASVEALTRSLAGEVGKYGVRVICVRANFTPETIPGAEDGDLSMLIKDTLLGRLPKLAEVGQTVAFAASDHSGAMTASILNLTCGAIPD